MGALTVGHEGGQKLYILGVAGYNKPIWDVLAFQGERRRLESVYTVPNLKTMSQLGKRCQWDLPRLGFAPGLVGLGFS